MMIDLFIARHFYLSFLGGSFEVPTNLFHFCDKVEA
jgi:hypothetical protein